MCFSISSVYTQSYTELKKALPEKLISYRDGGYGQAVALDGNYAVASGVDKDLSYHYKVFLLHFNGTEWQKIAVLNNSDAKANDNFGTDVSISGNIVVVGAAGANAAYVYVKPAEGWKDMTQTAKLTSTDGSDFGTSVSVSGNVIAVGAPRTTESIAIQGAVYVFEKPEGGWENMTQTAKLMASDATKYDKLGSSVYISGNTIVAGAPNNSEYGAYCGAAYVFIKPENGWVNATQTAKLHASDATDNNSFGEYVCISGDDILITSINPPSYSGKAYVFTKPETGWADMTENAILTASDGTANDYFGATCSISNNIITVGAFTRNRIYVFEKTSDQWSSMTETAILTGSGNINSSSLGTRLCISGDIIFSGAFGSSAFGLNSGAVFVFNKPETGWADASHEDFVLKGDSIPETGNHFGSSVSIDGNYAVVGQEGYNYNTGRAYVYGFNGSSWDKLAKLSASDSAFNHMFGCSVAISGDIIVIGAKYNNAVYLFEKQATGWTDMVQTAKLTPSDFVADDLFGASVDVDGDLVVVGAENHDIDSISNSGAVYIYEKPADGWNNMTQTAVLTKSGARPGENFGRYITVSGNTVAIANSYIDLEEDNTSVYVFEKSSEGWPDITQTAKLTLNSNSEDCYVISLSSDDSIIILGVIDGDEETGYVFVYEKTGDHWNDMAQTAALTTKSASYDDSEFGYSTDISGDLIISGASEYNGAVYLFEKPETGWEDSYETLKITASDGATGDKFGYSVSVDGNNLLIGSINADDVAVDNGAAYFIRYVVGTKINKHADLSFNTYPNPVTDYLYFEGNDITPDKIEVYDIAGRLQLTTKTGNNGKIDLRILKSGIYILKVSSAGKEYLMKFLKE
jgi:hypothetical protein